MPWHIHAIVHLPVGWLPTVDAPAPQADNLGMRTLLVVGVVTWFAALLVAAMVAGVRDIDDPVEGISQRHLWLLGILAWPVLLVGGTALAWWLFPFDSVCHTGATNPYAEINCGLGWGAVLAVVAVVVASLAEGCSSSRFTLVRKRHAGSKTPRCRAVLDDADGR